MIPNEEKISWYYLAVKKLSDIITLENFKK